MNVLGDAIARNRRSDATALRVPTAGRSYDYRQFCTSAWKVGNFLRHHGVRGGDVVVVADDPKPQSVLSLFGAATLGGVVQFGPPSRADRAVGALVAPTDKVDRYDLGPGTKRIAYGERPADSSVAYFEQDVWSENPTEPPDRVNPATPLLETPNGTLTHHDLLSSATAVVKEWRLTAGSIVAVDAAFAHPGTIAAGLVAPIVAGGVACVGPDAQGDVTVGSRCGVDPDALIGDLTSS